MTKQTTLTAKPIYKFTKPTVQKIERSSPIYKKWTAAKRENKPVCGQWEYCINRDLYDAMHAKGVLIPVHVYAAMMEAKRNRQQVIQALDEHIAEEKFEKDKLENREAWEKFKKTWQQEEADSN